jgi:hypothetical protein
MNYFTPLSHGERAPVTRDLVWSGLRGHRRLARAARKKILERQISEDCHDSTGHIAQLEPVCLRGPLLLDVIRLI